jgi:large conductance mechanosensitive channel
MALTNKLESFEPAKRVGSFFEEFRNFAFKGNMVDLAIGVVIGAAFGAIIKSLVDNIIMPLITIVLPGQNAYQNMQWEITSHMENGTKIIDRAIPYGKFIADLVNFLVVSFVVFLFLKKFVGWIMRTKAAPPALPAPPTKDQELLMEIRDLLKQRAA